MDVDVARTLHLARWWWTYVVRGAIAILFGILAFVAPGFGLVGLVALFAAWAIIDGVGSLIAGIRTRGGDRSWWLEVLEGLVSVAAGAVALLVPDIAARALVLIIGAWAVLTGIIEIVLAVRLRRVIEGEVWMALGGVASIVFGAVLVIFPATGALSLVWLIGSFAIAFGVFLVILGWRLRGIDALARR